MSFLPAFPSFLPAQINHVLSKLHYCLACVMDTDDDDPIVHLKDRNRYTSLDRRGPCSLDASELRIQDEIISSMDDKNNDVNKILLLMCVQLDEMMDDSDRIPDHLNRRSDAIDTLIKSRTFSSPSSSVDSVLTSKKPNQNQLSNPI